MSHLNKTEQLECYAFWWSEIRLIVAGVALLIGGVPPIYLIAPAGLFGLARLGLVICWIISGVAALYLGYRWYEKKMVIFGGKDNWDSAAFALLIVTGLNLGLAGVFGTNIGMSIIGGRLIFFLVGILYLVVAYHLNKRWRKNGKLVF